MTTRVEAIDTSVPSFATTEEVLAAQAAKREQCGEIDLYPRDGSRALTRVEKAVARVLGIKEDHLLLYNTGMLAIGDAIDISNVTMGTRILRSYQHYSQAGKMISKDFGEGRKAAVFAVNSGSVPDIKRALEVRRPEIVFFETVTNGSEMAVLETEEFLDLPILRELDPVIILDDTLPSSVLPLGKIMECSDRRIIGVDSVTKYFGLNGPMGGITYTYNEELLARLKERRQRWGTLLSTSAAEEIRSRMPETATEYDARLRAIFKHTLRLARACADSLGNGDEFVVVHPNLPDHPNSQYANSCAPEGISPVFFIIPTELGEDERNHVRIGDRLGKNPVINRLGVVEGKPFGQSFGFDRLRIWPDDNSPVVRISGGLYTEAEQRQLDEAFSESLSARR